MFFFLLADAVFVASGIALVIHVLYGFMYDVHDILYTWHNEKYTNYIQ